MFKGKKQKKFINSRETKKKRIITIKFITYHLREKEQCKEVRRGAEIKILPPKRLL